MPGHGRPRAAQRPYHLPRGTGVARGRGDFTVRHHPAARDALHLPAQLVEHYFAPVISASFEKNARLRSVVLRQSTGGDWKPSGSK